MVSLALCLAIIFKHGDKEKLLKEKIAGLILVMLLESLTISLTMEFAL